jgi:hypothetical protein
LAVWYSRDQWQKLRELSADKDGLEKTFAEWQTTAEEKIMELTLEGYEVQRVPIDVDQVAKWCEKRGRAFNAVARSEFVAEQLARSKKLPLKS